MKKLDEISIKNLLLNDSDITKTMFSSTEKVLQIFVEGAGLISDEGVSELGKGYICLKDWKSLQINKYNSETKKWTLVDESMWEPFAEICEIQFFDFTICLSGFGKASKKWIEWKIQSPIVQAEFDE